MIAFVKDLLSRAVAAAGRDNISIIAAGVAYFTFLALVPLLAVVILGYGLVVDTATVARHVQTLATNLPEASAELIGGQLSAVVETSAGEKGLGLALAIGIALFGARNAASAIITALGIAYNSADDRGMIARTLLALAVTVGGVILAGLAATAMAALALLEDLLPDLAGFGIALVRVASYALFVSAAIIGAALLFRLAPNRAAPAWAAVWPGAVFAGLGWFLLTVLFGIYVSNFGNYNATYGSLGGVIVLLWWLYLSVYVLLFGAELNAVKEYAER